MSAIMSFVNTISTDVTLNSCKQQKFKRHHLWTTYFETKTMSAHFLSNFFAANIGRFSARQSPLPMGRQVLESLFAKTLKDRLELPEEEIRSTVAFVSKAFESTLNSSERIGSSVDLFLEHFSRDQIRHNPQLFLLHYKTLSKRLGILEELSIQRPDAVLAESCFISVLKNHSFRSLQQSSLCPPNVSLVSTCLHSANCGPSLSEQITERLHMRWNAYNVSASTDHGQLLEYSPRSRLWLFFQINGREAGVVVSTADSGKQCPLYARRVPNVSPAPPLLALAVGSGDGERPKSLSKWRLQW